MTARSKNDIPIVMIATPCYTGEFNEYYVKSLMETFSNIYTAGIGVLWSPLCGNPYLAQARCVLLHGFLTHPANPTHLCFIDADMSWGWDAFPRLIETGKDVIGIPYINRHQDKYCHDVIPGKSIIDGVVEVKGTGTGFLMLSRKAAQAVSDAAKESSLTKINGVDERVPMSISTTVRNDRFVGEDINLCYELAELGMPTFIHTDLQAGHLRKWMAVGNTKELKASFSSQLTLI